jgi:hypothetical protein
MLKGYHKEKSATLDDFFENGITIVDANECSTQWIGMPEFVNEEVNPYARIVVRFDNADSLAEFAKLINQHLTHKTLSIWYPMIPRGLNSDLRYE